MTPALLRCAPFALLLTALTFATAADDKPAKPDGKVPTVKINGKPLAKGQGIVIPGEDGKPLLVLIGDDGKPVMRPATPEDLKKYPVMTPNPDGSGKGTVAPPPRKVEKPAKKFEDTAAVEKRVKSALAWIAKSQKPDGSWPTGMGDNRPAIVVTTSYCGMALMASGNKQYVPHVSRAVKYVTDNILQDRAVVKLPENLDQSNWKIAIGGYFLCEYYGDQKRKNPKFKAPALQGVIEKVVADAGKRIEETGGWGHMPRIKNPLDYLELEIMSNWMLAMWGAAKELGFKVPNAPLARSITFIEECCNQGRGDVGYSPRKGQKGFGCPCRTGGALFAFQLLGKEDHTLYPLMVKSYKENLVDSNEGHGSLAIGFLTSGMAARHLEEDVWQEFKDRFFQQILDAGEKNGSIGVIKGKSPKAQANADGQVGAAYTTGIYALMLQLDGGKLRFTNRKAESKE
ncbi:hypothetical protein AYO40_02715 [Planctomycetaceae bacterium SCGC AG-212-D15]|nr:hypothetical protein AYO40_02715 [Planctomycetaceae bacterium SCGC AG-212-D15]